MVDDALLSAGPHGDGSDEVPPGNETEAEPGRGVAPLVVVAIAVVALAIGFGLGSLRSSSDVDRGASPTTSVVGAPPGASTTTPAAAGTSEPPATAAPADEAPSVPPISAAASFDDAVPTEVGGDPVEGGEGWTTEGGTAVPPAAAKSRALRYAKPFTLSEPLWYGCSGGNAAMSRSQYSWTVASSPTNCAY